MKPLPSSAATSSPPASLVLQVQPARAESPRDLTGLETAMQSLALDSRSPIALDIAAATTPTTTRSFLLRAQSPVALGHLSAQVQSRYPQARILPVAVDPLVVTAQEECSVVELLPGAASYLPLRVFRAQDLRNAGVDPLLGILAAFDQLPPGARAVAQLALLPASPTWSHADRTLAFESSSHRAQRAGEQPGGTAPGLGRIAALLVLVIVLLLVSRWQKILLPPWLIQAGSALVQGHTPTLSLAHTALLVGGGLALLVLVGGGAVLGARVLARFASPASYDPRLIAEKVMRPAYRTRLRLFVITPGEEKPLLAGHAPTWKQMALVWSSSFKTGVAGVGRHCRRALAHRRWLLVCMRQLHPHARSLSHLWGQLQPQVLRGKCWLSAVQTDWCAAWLLWRTWRAAMRLSHHQRRDRAQQRRDVLRMLVAAYAQYHLASGGYFTPRALPERVGRRLLLTEERRVHLLPCGWSAGLPRSPHLMSVADLAALWHLPQAQDLPTLSHLAWTTARTLLAPPVLTSGPGYLLGSSTHAGRQVPVFLPWSCLRHNMLACASTGKGKSSWLLHLALALFEARTTNQLPGGLMQIDVHGDLHQQTLASVPPALEDEVVQINLAERNRCIGLNPLDVSTGADRDKLVDTIIALIEALWPNAYGPRTENILEYACKTLVEANRTIVARDPVQGPDAQYTLLDVVPLVREHSFRHAILEQVHDPFIHAWWDQYYERNDARQQQEFSSSVVTKFSKFASSHVTRRILGQPRSTINFAEIIAQEKVLLINCASGGVGADIAAFVGAILLGLFHVALAEQARMALSERQRFLVLVDEFQALKGVDYQTMLAEVRKYGGSFALATQSLAYLDRLDRTLRATVLANIDHLFAFAMSADDAYLLRLESVEPEDLVNLPNYTCYARLLLNEQRLPLFSLRLRDPLAPSLAGEEEAMRAERSRRISLRSHLRYARPVGDVDALLLSLQARTALLMQPGKKKPARTAGASASPSGTEQPIGAPRGTRKRGSGKGRLKRPASEAGAQTAPTSPDAQVIHELFVPSEPGAEEEPVDAQE